jgi:ABC-type sulfate/molybdate transport systems ATPase subunit
VLVTHDPTVARHTKRVVMMRDGRAVREESVMARLDARAVVAGSGQSSAPVPAG